MVSSKVKDELRTAYDALKVRAINVHSYSGELFDAVFDIVTLETAIAGIADTILSDGVVSAESIGILQAPIFADERKTKMLRREGPTVNLSAHSKLLKHLRAIDRLREMCLQIYERP